MPSRVARTSLASRLFVSLALIVSLVATRSVCTGQNPLLGDEPGPADTPIDQSSLGYSDPIVEVHRAKDFEYPNTVDCNSPSFWDGDHFYVFNSHEHPKRLSGKDLLNLGESVDVVFDNKLNGGRWIEAVIKVPGGPLYGWYHFEPKGLCRGNNLTSAEIGAIKSMDNGLHWTDLGIILKPADGSLRCDAKNGAVAGGHGDFCVLLDQKQKYLYIYFSNYSAPFAEQGVNVARMDWIDRDHPIGKTFKWYKNEFQEPGLGGKMTPIFPAAVDFLEYDPDSFWGPSIHWNTHVNKYVMLLNHAQGHNYRQEGIYVSLCSDAARPDSWSKPKKLLEGTPYETHMTQGHSRDLSPKEKIAVRRWYPAIQGLSAQHGTDKLAGRKARFFLNSTSTAEIEFIRLKDTYFKTPR